MTDELSTFLPVGQVNGVLYLAVPAEWAERVTAATKRFESMFPPPVGFAEQLQRMADDNRANAGDKFPNLTNLAGSWYDEEQDPVVFTPYGYRKEREVHDEIRG